MLGEATQLQQHCIMVQMLSNAKKHKMFWWNDRVVFQMLQMEPNNHLLEGLKCPECLGLQMSTD